MFSCLKPEEFGKHAKKTFIIRKHKIFCTILYINVSLYCCCILCLFYISKHIFMSVLHIYIYLCLFYIYIYIYVCSTYIWNVYFYWKNKQVHRSGALTQYSTYSWVLSSLILKYLENVRYLKHRYKIFYCTIIHNLISLQKFHYIQYYALCMFYACKYVLCS